MNLPDKLALFPIKNISGTVDLPGSKSLSNRILLLSMLAEGQTEIHNLLDSDDTRRMVEALKTLKATSPLFAISIFLNILLSFLT